MPLVDEMLKAIAEADFPQFTPLLSHVLIKGGKRIRPALTLLSGKFYRYDPDLLIPMATGVELLHTATLVHDDTIDSSSLRRGSPTVHTIWGDKAAILMGDYLFAKSAELVATTGNLRVMRLSAQIIMTISSGELEESFSAYNTQQSREQYYQRCSKKTASLFSMASESGAILSQAPEEAIQALKSYGYNIGLAFQLVDDILDFTGDEREMGKPVGSDLLQGTLTLPTILLLERYPEDNPTIKVLGKRDTEENIKRVIEMLSDSPVIEDCYAIAEGFSEKACQALEVLPDNPSRKALLDLADYVIQRQR
jgi:geranylgeranyl pyrophosphate synthase